MRSNCIYDGPCRDLCELPDESTHVVVTSPHYNISYNRQRSKKHNLDGYGAFDDRMPEEEYQDQQVALLDACGRVLTRYGSVFYNHKDRRKDKRTRSPMEWILRVPNLELYQTIVWDRLSSHNVDPIRMPPTIEYIYWLCKPGQIPRFDKACRKWGLVWRFSPHAETGRIDHPAPFPVAIPMRCIMMSAPNPGDIVLDPYLGSGSTAVSATHLGLLYVGYEINGDYTALAERRIEAARARWS